jgi:cytochrome c biogenesis protein CcmG/thiol:disulfide interchange protein DsbE
MQLSAQLGIESAAGGDLRYKIIGLNYKDSSQNAQTFLFRYGDPYALVGIDADGRAGIDWGVYGVPESFVVSGDGRILFKHVGPLNAEVIKDDILPRLQGKRK